MVVFQVLTWETQDTEDEHLISIFGKTNEGKSVCVTTSFTPYFFVKLPKKTTSKDASNLYMKIDKTCPECLISYDMVQSKDVWGFQNNEARNARVRAIEEPLVLLSHHWQLGKQASIQTNLGYQWGTTKNSRVDYTGSTLISNPNEQEHERR